MAAHLEVDIKHVHQLARPLDPFRLARLGVLVAPIHTLHQAPPHQQLDEGAQALLLWLACSERDNMSHLLLAAGEGALVLLLWLACGKRKTRHPHAALLCGCGRGAPLPCLQEEVKGPSQATAAIVCRRRCFSTPRLAQRQQEALPGIVHFWLQVKGPWCSSSSWPLEPG